MSLKEIDIKDLKINPCTLIGDEWALISSGNETSWNCMTASWAHIGALWGSSLDGRATTVIYIRPSRFTDKFIDKEETYTMSFFKEDYKKDLLYLGTHSGRDENKISKTKLTPVFIDGTVAYKEASLVLVCKKLYKGNITPDGFIDKNLIDKWYKDGDFHHVYVGSIMKAYTSE